MGRGSRRKTGTQYMYVTITLARGVHFSKALPETWSWMWEIFLTLWNIYIFMESMHKLLFFDFFKCFFFLRKGLIDRFLTRSMILYWLSPLSAGLREWLPKNVGFRCFTTNFSGNKGPSKAPSSLSHVICQGCQLTSKHIKFQEELPHAKMAFYFLIIVFLKWKESESEKKFWTFMCSGS